jgi:hypothetical protein
MLMIEPRNHVVAVSASVQYVLYSDSESASHGPRFSPFAWLGCQWAFSSSQEGSSSQADNDPVTGTQQASS